ncbi:MAG TPA: class I adenylate-forming enzyme family protein [Acidimicrobiales bacterium]|nr:class I adenylate-forming enzyme family protein [Acidimicrobiales bacterium]
MNVLLLLEMAAGEAPERVALGDLRAGLTYGRLLDLAQRAGRHALGRGAGRLLYTDISGPALPVALFGAAAAGIPFVPLNYRLADDRLRALVGRQAPAMLLCASGMEDRLAGIDGVEVVTTDAFLAALDADADGDPTRDPTSDVTSHGGTEAELPPFVDPEDVAVLLHTSGTSGEPKVAVLRHRHLASYVLGSVDFLAAGEDEASLVSVPPYHIAGISALLTSVYGGRRLVQLPSFDPAAWVTAAREQHVTHAMVVPTMLARILDALDPSPGPSTGAATGAAPTTAAATTHVDGWQPALPRLRHLSYGGGRMPLPVIERAMALIPGVDFVNAYGLTETSSSVAVLGPDDHRAAFASDDPAVRRRLASVGRPVPTVEIDVRDAEGRPVPAGGRGEVWVRGEQVSGEYVDRAGRDTGGWFPTNDEGWFDDEGYLYVEGRMDDVIVRGGENLSPGEIEDALLTHPAVAEAVVVGLPDDEWGEVVAAAVVLHPGAAATAGELSDWVVAGLRSSRRPAVVEVRQALPYNDTGKVLRRVVKAELEAPRHTTSAA